MRNFLRKNIRKFRQWRVLRSVKSHKGEIFIGGATQLTAYTELGYNPNFNGLTIKGCGSVKIGNNFHSGEDCLFITENHNYDSGNAIPYDSTYIYKKIIIEDNVWLGDRVVVLGGVTIGEGAIIQAGSVVVKDIPALAIAGGSPAKVFKKRDEEHYNKLKKLKLFH